MTYLDHINGRKHQRFLGYSMRVEKSKTSEVAAKLVELARNKQEQEQQAKRKYQRRNGIINIDTSKFEEDIDEDLEDNDSLFEKSIRQKDEIEVKRKADRMKRKEERKRRKKEEKDKQEQENLMEQNDNSTDNDNVDEDDNDAQMRAMMGFNGFK